MTYLEAARKALPTATQDYDFNTAALDLLLQNAVSRHLDCSLPSQVLQPLLLKHVAANTTTASSATVELATKLQHQVLLVGSIAGLLGTWPVILVLYVAEELAHTSGWDPDLEGFLGQSDHFMDVLELQQNHPHIDGVSYNDYVDSVLAKARAFLDGETPTGSATGNTTDRMAAGKYQKENKNKKKPLRR